jgi:hypothetical protein
VNFYGDDLVADRADDQNQDAFVVISRPDEAHMALDGRQKDRPSVEFHVSIPAAGGKTVDDKKFEIGHFCYKFEWACFLNSGHRVTASFKDTYQNSLDRSMIRYLLEHGQKELGIDVECRIWQDFNRAEDKKTALRKFKVLTMNSNILGGLTESVLEFVCIDVASWALNQGICEGDAYKGNISTVIADVVAKRGKKHKLTVRVDETTDNNNNIWYDMRLDPKTFISSLLEWSSAVTKRKTPLVVCSQDLAFECIEWASMTPTKTNGKKFEVATAQGGEKDISDRCELQFLSNNLLAPAATRLYVGKIATTTGLYIDPRDTRLSAEQRYAGDDTTQNKLLPKIAADQGFAQSNTESSTFIEPIPEHNNGDLGIKYQDYIVGRARDWYNKMIYSTMRVKITTEVGDTDFDDIHACGRDTINLHMIGYDNIPYFLNGLWLLYGFKHMIDWEHWHTELMLSRLCHDATGKDIT